MMVLLVIMFPMTAIEHLIHGVAVTYLDYNESQTESWVMYIDRHWVIVLWLIFKICMYADAHIIER